MAKIKATHPGEVLLEDFMKPLGLSQYRVAKDISVTTICVSEIITGKRSITVDTALRLGRYFGTSPDVWLSLQTRYDLETAHEKAEKNLEEVPVLERV